MLMLSNPNAMILMTDFEKAGGGGQGGGGGDQKRFLELPRAEARQLKTARWREGLVCLSKKCFLFPINGDQISYTNGCFANYSILVSPKLAICKVLLYIKHFFLNHLGSRFL